MQALQDGQYAGDVLAAAASDGLLVSRTRYRPAAGRAALHYHASPHLSLFLSPGFAVRRRDGETQVGQGEVTLFRADEPHLTLTRADHAQAVNLEVQADFFRRYDLDESIIDTALRRAPGALLIMLSVHRELLRADAPAATAIHLHLLYWLAGAAGGRARQPLPAWVVRLRECVHAHWNDALSLQMLAVRVGCHPVTIAKNFPRYFGCTFGAYVRRLRAEHAALEIQRGADDLTTIAHRCGFADHSHLSRTLRALTGLSPRQLRRPPAG